MRNVLFEAETTTNPEQSRVLRQLVQLTAAFSRVFGDVADWLPRGLNARAAVFPIAIAIRHSNSVPEGHPKQRVVVRLSTLRQLDDPLESDADARPSCSLHHGFAELGDVLRLPRNFFAIGERDHDACVPTPTLGEKRSSCFGTRNNDTSHPPYASPLVEFRQRQRRVQMPD